MVDGKIWVASSKYSHSPIGNYINIDKNGYYNISVELQEIHNKNSYILLSASIPNFKLNSEYTIPMNQYDNYSKASYGYYGSSSRHYSTNFPKYTGIIKITRFDIHKQIVSGTFEFEAEDKDGNKVHITEGRFDRKF